jgi:hypothetical protein
MVLKPFALILCLHAAEHHVANSNRYAVPTVYAFMFEFHNTEITLLPGNQLVKSIPGISAGLKYFYIPTQSWNSSTDAISSEVEFTKVFYMRNLFCQAELRCTGSGWFLWWKASFTVLFKRSHGKCTTLCLIPSMFGNPFWTKLTTFLLLQQ